MDLTRYGYDRTSGVYVGPVEAIPDPERQGAVLEPAFCTPIAPADVPAGNAAVWSGASWISAPDHRGETWYRDRNPVLIADVGDPEAIGLTPDPAPLPPAPPPDRCTRLGLRRAFVELNLWPMVKAFIASDSDLQEEWDLATELRLSDPIMKRAIAAFALQGITIDPVALATRANELVS